MHLDTHIVFLVQRSFNKALLNSRLTLMRAANS